MFKAYTGKFQLQLLHLILGFYFPRIIKEDAANRFFRPTEKKWHPPDTPFIERRIHVSANEDPASRIPFFSVFSTQITGCSILQDAQQLRFATVQTWPTTCTHTHHSFKITLPNTDQANEKYPWATTSNFSQAQLSTPWWWIAHDPKHVGVIFNCILKFIQSRF